MANKTASEVVGALEAKLHVLTEAVDDGAVTSSLSAATGGVSIGSGATAGSLVVPKTWGSAPKDAISVAMTMFLTGANALESGSVKLALCLSDGTATGEAPASLCGELGAAADTFATAAGVLDGDGAGAGAPLRQLVRTAARRLLEALRALCASLAKGDGKAAARSGVVWEAAEAVRKLPQSNRVAYRREFLSWATELKDTIAEFADLVAAEKFSYDEVDCVDCGFGFGDDDDDAYDAAERPVAAGAVDCLRLLGATYKDVLVAMDEEGKRGDLTFVAKIYAAGVDVKAAATALAEELYPPLDAPKLKGALDGAKLRMAAVLDVLERRAPPAAPQQTQTPAPPAPPTARAKWEAKAAATEALLAQLPQ